MKPIIFEFKESDEHLSSHSGLALIGALLERTKLKDRISEKELTGCREPKISHHDIVYSMIGLLCIGKPNYDAIEAFRADPFFTQSLWYRDVSFCTDFASKVRYGKECF